MFSAMLIRVGTIALHSIMGGMAVFCLWYAAQVTNPNVVRWLVFEALKCGVPCHHSGLLGEISLVVD